MRVKRREQRRSWGPRTAATLGCLAAAALAIGAIGATTAQATEKAYGGEFYWGCTYSWGAPCVEPHYHPKLETLLTMSADESSELSPGRPTQNRYPAAKPDHAARCVAAAGWDGSQITPWSSGEELVVSGGGGGPGYGEIGTCAVYYSIALYQVADWEGES